MLNSRNHTMLVINISLCLQQESVKVEQHTNEHDILEINVSEISDDMLSQNLTPNSDIQPDRSMEPAEIIR